jgi:preprotein translocase subunit SecD
MSLWILLAVIGVYFLYPLRTSLRFGIDLVGGTYITLEVQTDKAVEAELLEQLKKISEKLETAGKIPSDKRVIVEVDPTNKEITQQAIILTFEDSASTQEAALLLRDNKELEQKTDNTVLRLSLPSRQVQRIQEEAVIRNIGVLRTRLDKLSVAEIAIAAQGKRQIVIELPDVSDPQQAKAMIGKAAVLEFRPVEKIGATPDDIMFELDGELPGDMEILPGTEKRGSVTRYYLVPKYAEVSGKHLADARPEFSEQDAQMVVSFTLTSEGGRKFYELTNKTFGRPLAIVLDGVVISAPQVGARISDRGMISGDFDSAQAKELSALLKSGSFVAPVTFEEERQIGPVLGYESIRQSLIACAVSLILLFIFAVLLYKLSGVLAFLVLLWNLLLVLLGLSLMRATLTLPGIAGLILTVGMAIDASILIFERIRESLKEGASVNNAVQSGFSDAMAVILDSNITTFITGLILYKFGTGPVQGFAVTMMLGIISTLITGLFLLRSMFTVCLRAFNVQRLSI